jgi:hypothetical protein
MNDACAAVQTAATAAVLLLLLLLLILLLCCWQAHVYVGQLQPQASSLGRQ